MRNFTFKVTAVYSSIVIVKMGTKLGYLKNFVFKKRKENELKRSGKQFEQEELKRSGEKICVLNKNS